MIFCLNFRPLADAAVCPGTAPRSITGCCYRDCNHDNIHDIGSNSNGVYSHSVQGAVQAVCTLRGDVCDLCDEIDEFKPYIRLASYITGTNAEYQAAARLEQEIQSLFHCGGRLSDIVCDLAGGNRRLMTGEWVRLES